ncbi:MAG: efflux RND transporter periplasmic adaptor subunit [Cryomorphaceae bacterium]|nr:efflux RND transporter periplasmic adaptor subunit [Cryomorphaceae bacterium]
MKKSTRIRIAIIVILAIGLTIAWQKGVFGGDNALAVDFFTVEKRDLVEVVTTSGKIRPETEVKIAPEVSGEIIELHVQEGDFVEKGKLLVKINPDLYQAAYMRAIAATNNARAGLSQAKAQFVEAERNFNRNKDLHKKGVISDVEFDGIQRAYDVARLGVEASEFQVKSARATEQEAGDNLKRTTIYSPATGTISMLNVDVGERVVGTAQMAGTELLRIANLNQMQVLVEVNENEVIKVNCGDSVTIKVEAYPDKIFYGDVARVAIASRNEQNATDQITVFEVLVNIFPKSYADLKADHPLRHGMTATVDIITKTVFDVVAVPVQAVTTRFDTTGDNSHLARLRKKEKAEDFTCVFLHENGTSQMRKVTVGIQDDEFLEITEGLQTGEEIISGPFSAVSTELKNGVSVKNRSL